MTRSLNYVDVSVLMVLWSFRSGTRYSRPQFKVSRQVSNDDKAAERQSIWKRTDSLVCSCVMGIIPHQPSSTALVDSDDAYDRCSRAIYSCHKALSRIRGDVQRHCSRMKDSRDKLQGNQVSMNWRGRILKLLWPSYLGLCPNL